MEELVERMKKMSSEELYLKALEYKTSEDFCKYRIHLTMSANCGFEKAIQEHQYEFIHSEKVEKVKNTDFSDAVRFFELTRNELFSMLELSNVYKRGKYVKQDLKKAFELNVEAYEKGNKYVANNLGFQYQKGLGVAPNYQKAAEFYENAASFGCRDGINNLGFMYLSGYWVQQNYEKAFELFQLAKEKGNYSANLHMARMYVEGFFVEQNYEIAIDLLEEAASKGNISSFSYLIHIYKRYREGRGQKKYVEEYFIKLGISHCLIEIYGYTKDYIDTI